MIDLTPKPKNPLFTTQVGNQNTPVTGSVDSIRAGLPTIGNLPSTTQGIGLGGQTLATVPLKTSQVTLPKVNVGSTNPTINANVIGTQPVNGLPQGPVTTPASDNLGITVASSQVTTPPIPTAETTATPIKPVETKTQSTTDLIREYLGLQAAQSAEEVNLQKEYDTANLELKNQQLKNEYASTSKAYDDQIKAIEKNPQGWGANASQEISRITREKNSALADIAILQNAANGNLETANKIIESKIKAQFEPIQNNINNFFKLAELENNNLTEKEKFQLTQKAKETQDQIDNIQTLQKDAYKAMLESGKMTQEMASAISNATTLEEIAQATNGLYQGQSQNLNSKQTQNFLTISNKYQADAIIQNMNKGLSAIEIADQVIANPENAGNQLKILYTLVKNLDPDSAVREGELDLASRTQSYLGKFETNLARINKGKLLSKAATLELAKATKDLAGVWKNAGERRNGMYKSQANVAGIGPAFDEYLSGSVTPTQSEGNSLYDF